MSPDDEIVMIELIDDDSVHDGDDVSFGMGQRRARSGGAGSSSGPGLKIAAGVLGVVALGATAMAFSRNDAGVSAQTTNSTVPESPRTTSAPLPLPTDFTPIELNPNATLAPTTTVFADGVGPLFAIDPGMSLGLYVASGDNSDTVLRVDVATGVVTVVEDRTVGRVRAVAPGPDGPRFVDDSVVGADAWSTVVGPDETVWAPDPTSDGIVQFDLTGERLRTVRQPPGSVFGNSIAGVLADGRPVLVGPDARAYAVNPDDTYERVGDGFVISVQPGGYWETVCDTAAACQAIIHGVGQPPFTVDFARADQTSIISLSPSGRFAMVVISEAPSIIDLASGIRTEVPDAGAVIAGPFGYFGAAQPGVWYGDGDRYLVFPSNDSLAVYDTITSELRSVPMPPGTYNEIPLGFAT